MLNKKEIQNFWNNHPLGSYEIPHAWGSKNYFIGLNKIRNSSSYFVLDFYEFKKNKNKKVLDVGCGPGWVTKNYAKARAKITSVDLSANSVFMAKKHLAYFNLKSNFNVADAEKLPFKDNTFDFICSDGVLHHTLDTKKGVQEIYRVLRPGGKAVISFYYKNFIIYSKLFFITKILMSLLQVKTPHGIKKVLKLTPQELVRRYDGADNPKGVALSKNECKKIFLETGFKILNYRTFYFPYRFVPLAKYLPKSIKKYIDKYLGLMIFYKLKKPK